MRENIFPIKVYQNCKLQKSQILQENKNKSGIYRWTNLLKGKSYIGSSKNIRNRLYSYYSESTLKKSGSLIYKAILKYKHENFSLEILEYCSPENKFTREQFYLDNCKHEYNTRQAIRKGKKDKYK